MNARAIVAKLLEADPDEVDPKHELMRNDPAYDIKQLVHELQNEAAFTIGYSRAGDILKLVIRLHEWTTEEHLENWVHSYLQDLGYEIERGAITAVNLGHMHQGRSWKVMFPFEGPDVRWVNLT